jgi:hypothetical protein
MHLQVLLLLICWLRRRRWCFERAGARGATILTNGSSSD